MVPSMIISKKGNASVNSTMLCPRLTVWRPRGVVRVLKEDARTNRLMLITSLTFRSFRQDHACNIERYSNVTVVDAVMLNGPILSRLCVTAVNGSVAVTVSWLPEVQAPHE